MFDDKENLNERVRYKLVDWHTPFVLWLRRYQTKDDLLIYIIGHLEKDIHLTTSVSYIVHSFVALL